MNSTELLSDVESLADPHAIRKSAELYVVVVFGRFCSESGGIMVVGKCVEVVENVGRTFSYDSMVALTTLLIIGLVLGSIAVLAEFDNERDIAIGLSICSVLAIFAGLLIVVSAW